MPSRFDLLLFGGARDPSIICLHNAAIRNNISCLLITHDESEEPSASWNVETGSLVINGQEVSSNAAFLRYDVFSTRKPQAGDLDRAFGWYSTLYGACTATLGVLVPNKRMDARANNKLFMLASAQSGGIPIPNTLVTNDKGTLDQFCETNLGVAKPVGGGAYCIDVKEANNDADWSNNKAPIPAIIQERLAYPEYRIFRFGKSLMTFQIESEHLDYRPYPDAKIVMVDNDILGKGVPEKLLAMSDALGIDFFACDFKSHADSGTPMFLELNSGPMFAAYDASAKGKLSDGMIKWLVTETESATEAE
ncbi:hypothetical protein F9L33_09625 [Amylibacter sp. SFDW26]|uniref:ATP-grasp domain-containing protein n=1 Tax=Amylibacter sp. SFDW26 TaxID=2652722 RepID=UPI0012620D05|nr:hypothetical protein [Amylibacter sp. SFDW26]KAB7613628.1 hypothetical protein F9L33_09625 [Amylibacter sp. SFDW26]